MRFALVLAGLCLAGCMQGPPPVVVNQGPDLCRASAYQGFVGQPLSNFRINSVSAPVRVLAPGGIMTMDFRGDRMNVTHDSSTRITRIYCG